SQHRLADLCGQVDVPLVLVLVDGGLARGVTISLVDRCVIRLCRAGAGSAWLIRRGRDGGGAAFGPRGASVAITGGSPGGSAVVSWAVDCGRRRSLGRPLR